MLQHFKHLYSDDIREDAQRRFGLTPVSRDVLPDASHSYVYDCERDDAAYILKITHTIHRQPHNIHGEVEFINFLADGGVTTPRAISSLAGNLVETIAADDGEFVVAAFEKADGALVDWRAWTREMFEQWGAVIGKMHALTKGYEPSDESRRRRFWHQDTDWNTEAEVYLTRPTFREKARRTRDWLFTLPTGSDCFGLIHSDLHQWNFFYHDGKVLPFDFDNTHYDWFIADFTTVVVNVVHCQQHHYARGEYDRWTAGTPMKAAEFLDYFFAPFIEGYRQHNRLDGVWLRRMPAFLNRHWLTFLTDALRDPKFAALTPEQQAATFPWRTLSQSWDEVMNDYWSRFDFDRYA
ncbi:MAG: phosphotransferase [Chloroflexi bacterium]|nr:phosphotransferase [Chloroflexota bacterium]